MSIKSVTNTSNSTLFQSSSSKESTLTDTFESFLANDLKALDEKKAQAKAEQQTKIEKFKQDLFNYGPMGLAFKLNMDKIQEKLDKKRTELEDQYDIKNLSGEEHTKALKAIDETMMIYERQLREEMRASKELDDQQNKS